MSVNEVRCCYWTERFPAMRRKYDMKWGTYDDTVDKNITSKGNDGRRQVYMGCYGLENFFFQIMLL